MLQVNNNRKLLENTLDQEVVSQIMKFKDPDIMFE